MRSHHIPIKIAKKQANETKIDNTKPWQRQELYCIAGGKVKGYNHFGKQVVSYKVKHMCTI